MPARNGQRIAQVLRSDADFLELRRISAEVPDAEHHLFSPEPEDIDQTVGEILRV